MKRKIFVALGLASALFTACGVYIIVTIQQTTDRLDKLVKLHQVEILRENLLLQVKGVQSDLTLTGTRYATSVDTMVTRSIQMGKVADRCFGCHHTGAPLESLKDLKAEVEQYKDALSRVLTLSANESRLLEEKDRTIRIGSVLLDKIHAVIELTSRNLTATTEAAFRQIATAKVMIFGLIAVGPPILILLGVMWVRGVTGPVGALLTATRRLKAGDLAHRVSGLKDEFGELETSFNEMAVSLREQMLQMRRTEQMVVVGELAAGLGHEVKNPLAGIRAAVNILSSELALKEDDRKLFQQIAEQVGRLEALMKGFLNFAKPPRPQLEAVDVNGLLQTTLDFYATSRRPRCDAARSIRVEQALGEAIPSITADPIQLQQVLLNLILNAVDAMPDGGVLSVHSGYDPGTGSVRIEVADTGRGIDPRTASKIFHPFFTTKPQGTGLGLAMCKQLIELHGGRLEAENRASGGAVFRVILPDRRTVAEAAS